MRKARNQAGFKISLELFVFRFGGAERDRTADLLVANEALSQLSYSPTPNPHRTPLSQAQRSRNNISECISNNPYPSTARVNPKTSNINRPTHPLAPSPSYPRPVASPLNSP